MRSGVVLVAAWVVSLGLAGCEIDASPRPAPRLDPPPAPVASVLSPATGSPVSASEVPVAELDRLITSGPLGPDPSAVVMDVTTGAVLYDRGGDVGRTPASVLKLVTAAAALAALEPQTRLRTTVMAGGPGEVVLVGSGDTTLTAARSVRGFPRRASLRDLAAQTARALQAGGASRVTVRVDDSRYAGPAVSPDWPASYVESGVVAPVSALSVDGGRVSPRSDRRAPDPALAAGEAFAELLRAEDVAVDGAVGRTPAVAGAEELAAVESPTVGELVELMLDSSDNDLAESLLRQVALASGRPATLADGTEAALSALETLGIPTQGAVMLDGSGLARGSRVAPLTLARLLLLAADDRSPAALDHVLRGLPVAGFSGTLSTRFLAGHSRGGAGVVRAKTGTLTGVSSLAGLTTVGGRAVVLVVMSDGVPGDTLAARVALDRGAAMVARGVRRETVTP